jgi:hypothetical protein
MNNALLVINVHAYNHKTNMLVRTVLRRES